MILNFNGDDDIQEEDDAGLESERAPAATAAQKSLQESSKKVEKQESLKQKSNALYAVQKRGSSISTSNQAGMTDESLANEDDIPKRNNHLDVAKKNRGMTYSGDLGEGARAKRQPTKFNKKPPKDSDEDSDEDDDDEEEEDDDKNEPRQEGSQEINSDTEEQEDDEEGESENS